MSFYYWTNDGGDIILLRWIWWIMPRLRCVFNFLYWLEQEVDIQEGKWFIADYAKLRRAWREWMWISNFTVRAIKLLGWIIKAFTFAFVIRDRKYSQNYHVSILLSPHDMKECQFQTMLTDSAFWTYLISLNSVPDWSCPIVFYQNSCMHSSCRFRLL